MPEIECREDSGEPCYPEPVQETGSSPPLDWKPVPPPRPLTLRGRYVTLEPLEAERHGPSIWEAVHGHDEVWNWMSDGPYATEPDLHRSLAQKQASPAAVFLAVVPEGRAPHQAAGYASYMRIEPAHGVVEVGNILFAPALQRTRAATEAMYLMARRVFDDLGYRRYEWKCNALNRASRRAALRLGFSFEGIFRQHMVIKDRNRDTAWFAMLDRDWPARKAALEKWLDPVNFNALGQQVQRLGP
jgi:RimJ/RimL family protein N-acetyltransferase